MRRLCLLTVLLILTACASAPPTPGPGEVILQDDFSKTTSGWNVHASADLSVDYANGEYLIKVETANLDVWGNPGLDLDDVALAVEAHNAGGTVNNEFGLTCRQSGENERSRFYFFVVSSDGYYAMGKVIDGQRTVLNPAIGSPQPAAAIAAGSDAVQHLRATCAGKHFSFWVNDTMLGEFDDGDLARGDVGLIAGTYDEAGAHVAFDNFSARRP